MLLPFFTILIYSPEGSIHVNIATTTTKDPIIKKVFGDFNFLRSIIIPFCRK